MIKNIFRISTGLASIAVILLSSCDSSRHKGFEEADLGLFYKFHRKDDSGKSPQLNDILFAHMSMSIKLTDEDGNFLKDSVLMDSDKNSDIDGLDLSVIPLSNSKYKGDLMEGLKMMHLGDSASFIVSSDLFFMINNGLTQLPQFAKLGDELIFNVGLVDIKTKEEAINYIQKLESKSNNQDKTMMDKMQAEEPSVIADYLKRKKINVEPTASGMYFIETAKGNGPKVKPGKKVTMQYTGYLLNGKKFDSSFDNGKPYTFTLGKAEVIAGWDEGVAMMNVGSSATFVIPSSLAYGSNGQGPIPPFSPLVFEVQLMKAE